jgi:hypothetical protein
VTEEWQFVAPDPAAAFLMPENSNSCFKSACGDGEKRAGNAL